MRVLILATLLLLGSVPARAELITLDFNVFPGDFDDSLDDDWSLLQTPYTTTNGIDILGGRLIDSYLGHLYADGLAALYRTNGSGVLFVRQTITTITAGAPFILESLRVAPTYGFDSGNGGEQIRFTGLVDGEIVRSFDVFPDSEWSWLTVDGSSLGMVDAIMISAVDATPFTDKLWLDDLTIHRAPEPATVLLVAVGAMGLFIRRRRLSHP